MAPKSGDERMAKVETQLSHIGKDVQTVQIISERTEESVHRIEKIVVVMAQDTAYHKKKLEEHENRLDALERTVWRTIWIGIGGGTAVVFLSRFGKQLLNFMAGGQ